MGQEGRSKGSIFAGDGLGSGRFKQENPWEKLVRIWVGETEKSDKFLSPGKYKDNGRGRGIIHVHWGPGHFLQDGEN